MPKVTKTIEDASYSVEQVISGLYWYKKQLSISLKVAVGLVLTLCISVGANVIFILDEQKPVYFAATPDLRIAPLVALDKPVLTEQGLLNWTTETITGAMSLDFLEWRKKLTALRIRFDPESFKSLIDALNTSGTLDKHIFMYISCSS